MDKLPKKIQQQGEVTAFDVADAIHRFHQGPDSGSSSRHGLCG